MNPFTIDGHPECVHTLRPDTWEGFKAQRDWFKAHDYRLRPCPHCYRRVCWYSPDGRLIHSFLDEVRTSTGRTTGGNP